MADKEKALGSSLMLVALLECSLLESLQEVDKEGAWVVLGID